MRVFLALACFAVSAAGAVSAQDMPLPADAQNADEFDFDLFSPTGPALISLGVASRRASAMATPGDFGFDMGDNDVEDANRAGVSFSVSPYWVGDRKLTLQQYRTETGKLARIAARGQASLGLARSQAFDETSWRIAFATQTELFDAQDYRYDSKTYQCLSEAWDAAQKQQNENLAQQLANAFREDEDADLDAIFDQGTESFADEAFLSARRQCRNAGTARLLGKRSWIVGGGVGWRSDFGGFEGFGYDGASVWTQYRQPVTSNGRFAVFALARGDFAVAVDVAEGAAVEADAYEAGGGAAFQTPRFRFDVTASYNNRTFDAALVPDDDFMRYNAVADIRIRENLWLEASAGFIQGSANFDEVSFGGKLVFSWARLLPGRR